MEIASSGIPIQANVSMVRNPVSLLMTTEQVDADLKKTFDKVAYQREYMRKRRAKNAAKGT